MIRRPPGSGKTGGAVPETARRLCREHTPTGPVPRNGLVSQSAEVACRLSESALRYRKTLFERMYAEISGKSNGWHAVRNRKDGRSSGCGQAVTLLLPSARSVRREQGGRSDAAEPECLSERREGEAGNSGPGRIGNGPGTMPLPGPEKSEECPRGRL